LGLAGAADADADDAAPTIDVGADGFAEFAADGGESLGEFGCGDAVAGEALVIELLEFFQLAGFEALEVAVYGFDSVSYAKSTVLILVQGRGDRLVGIRWGGGSQAQWTGSSIAYMGREMNFTAKSESPKRATTDDHPSPKGFRS
jgi:hypothetical protein